MRDIGGWVNTLTGLVRDHERPDEELALDAPLTAAYMEFAQGEGKMMNAVREVCAKYPEGEDRDRKLAEVWRGSSRDDIAVSRKRWSKDLASRWERLVADQWQLTRELEDVEVLKRRKTRRAGPKRTIPKSHEMLGKAKMLEDALWEQTEVDTGKSLSDMLRDAGGVSHETFGKSPAFAEARQRWGTLKSNRETSKAFQRDRMEDRDERRRRDSTQDSGSRQEPLEYCWSDDYTDGEE